MAANRFINDTFLDIARGLVRDTTSTHRFGAVPAMSQSNTGSIWDVNDTVYPWSAYTTAAVVNVERNDADDDGVTVVVRGLDANYEEATDTITIDGENTLGTVQFIRVYSAVSDAVTNDNIDIEYGAAGGTTIARIPAGETTTAMAIYTVPAGKTAYLMQGVMTCQSGADATGNMYVKPFGQSVFTIGHTFEVTGSEYFYKFATPIKITEKSDIDVRATVRSNNARITAAFDIILIDN